MALDLETIKQENSNLLRDYGIFVIDHLPTIEPLSEVSPKSPQVVALRACALGYVVGLGYGAKKRNLRSKLRKFGLWESVTVSERKALHSWKLSETEKVRFQWLVESLQALAWCLGLTKLGPFEPCDDELVTKIPMDIDPSQFVNSAQLRSISDLQTQVDLHYRLHWFARSNRLSGQTDMFDFPAIEARRQALDWVYGVEDAWDEIDLST
ncbi:MAG: DUF4272 domain-containing protein [Pseudomonadota bacterium]